MGKGPTRRFRFSSGYGLKSRATGQRDDTEKKKTNIEGRVKTGRDAPQEMWSEKEVKADGGGTSCNIEGELPADAEKRGPCGS